MDLACHVVDVSFAHKLVPHGSLISCVLCSRVRSGLGPSRAEVGVALAL